MSLIKTPFRVLLTYLAVVLIITMVTGIAPLWQFGIAAVVCICALPVIVWADQKFSPVSGYEPATELATLLTFIRFRDWQWDKAAHYWIGRQIRIIENIEDARDLLGHPVALHRGMVGEIIDLNDEPLMPFRVRFAGHAYPVDVFVHRLELVSQVESSP